MSAPIDAVLIRIRQVDGPDLERWCRRVFSRRVRADMGTTEHLYAYSDIHTGHHYPPARCVEVREGRVEVRVVEIGE